MRAARPWQIARSPLSGVTTKRSALLVDSNSGATETSNSVLGKTIHPNLRTYGFADPAKAIATGANASTHVIPNVMSTAFNMTHSRTARFLTYFSRETHYSREVKPLCDRGHKTATFRHPLHIAIKRLFPARTTTGLCYFRRRNARAPRLADFSHSD
jgi:hypothetical protein